MLADTDKNGELFFDAMEGVFAEQLQNLEKALKALSFDSEFIPGKRTTAHFNIANIYVALTTKSIRGKKEFYVLLRHSELQSYIEKSW